MKTKITKMNNDWVDVKNECRNTVNKEPTENSPSDTFKKDLLISEHSPIRLLEVKWRWENIKSWISVHFARHWLGWDKWISTQRSDRTGVDRDKSTQETPVSMDIKANAQSLINVARFRLCYQASKETREYMEDLKISIHKEEPEIADVMVPNCLYRCGCPEFSECGFWKAFIDQNTGLIEFTDIKRRYDKYNLVFYAKKDFQNTTED